MGRIESLPERPDLRTVADQMLAARRAFERGDYATALELWGPPRMPVYPRLKPMSERALSKAGALRRISRWQSGG